MHGGIQVFCFKGGIFMKTNTQKTQQLVVTAMLCAISFIAVLIGRLIPNVAGFLSYDPKDAIVVIAGFIYGPMTSVIVSLIVSFIEMITISGTGIYGFIMNTISTCAFAVPAALIYKQKHNMVGAVAGLLAGMIAMTGVMLLWNYIITPFYMLVERSVVVSMLVPVFLPFNLIKSGINAGLTLVLYKPIITALRKAHLVPQKESSSGRHFHIGFTLFSVVVLATFILLFMVFTGVI